MKVGDAVTRQKLLCWRAGGRTGLGVGGTGGRAQFVTGDRTNLRRALTQTCLVVYFSGRGGGKKSTLGLL
jgi:hypothetical protein